MIKRVSLLIVIFMLIMNVGCSNKSAGATATPASSVEPSSDVKVNNLPLVSEPVTLTYWMQYPQNLGQYGGKSHDSSISFQELERTTGIHIQFVHPTSDNVYDDYKLMLASRNYTDLVSNPMQGYPGGIESAIENDVFVDLGNYIEQYAPNYMNCLQQSRNRIRDASTDKGYFAAFWQINEPEQGPWIGPGIRKDWLDQVGMDTPITIEDWQEMLRAFRDEIGSTTPYKLPYSGVDAYSNILSAFGTGDSFYRIGSQIHYGPAEETYFDYLRLMHLWYDEGLINPSFYIQRNDAYSAGIPDGIGASSVIYTYLGSGVQYNQHIDDPNAQTVAVPYPVLKLGDKIHIRRYNPDIATSNTSITTACKDVITAIRWMDYSYSDDGAMVLNYGVEGVTYTHVDGNPKLSDMILNNSEGIPPQAAMSKMLSLVHPTRYMWQRELAFVSEEGKDAIENIWNQADADYVLPPITLTVQEGREYLKLMSQIETYVSEITVKIIMGIEPADMYTEYIKKLNALGLRQVMGIEQAALNRYFDR